MNRDKIIREFVQFNNEHLDENEKPLTLAEARKTMGRMCKFLEHIFENGEEIKIKGYLKICTKVLKGRTYRSGITKKEHVIGDRLVPRCEFGTKIVDVIKNR